MMKRLAAILGLFVLTGCSVTWKHPTKGRSEFFADDRACQVASGGVTRQVEPGQERVSYEGCMWERGWHK